ncbi:MAG: aminotransferase class I/II-fold pyridoxal phosphate-dependent enzyme, partial [Gammaproteobacteria bacterium]|nr:aminotransferase class I/II-fold pyridoxal phosphate-dependent enzyme [Gammaproteobacteria bacterium]
MSRRARELDALNLGQGFPDYDIDPRLSELVAAAMQAGHNQYAPMEGLPALRERIAAKLRASYGVAVDPDTQITVTLGATEAIYSAVQALIGPGDEAIAFDPAYDSYEPAVRLAGGRCIRVPLTQPGFRYDWQRVREALSARTRLVLFNSPHNPACSIAQPADLDELARVIDAGPIAVLADEVYEHVVFDGAHHASVLAHPQLAPRSLAVFSFGKTLHATGLRVGYCVAPAALTREVRKVHQFNTFSISHP